MELYELVQYETEQGKVPFREWLLGLKDKKIRGRIRARLDRLRLGNFGDCKSLGQGLHELRFHFGAGFRIYYGLYQETIVVLMLGGSKARQNKDIELAKKYWKIFLRRNL